MFVMVKLCCLLFRMLKGWMIFGGSVLGWVCRYVLLSWKVLIGMLLIEVVCVCVCLMCYVGWLEVLMCVMVFCEVSEVSLLMVCLIGMVWFFWCSYRRLIMLMLSCFRFFLIVWWIVCGESFV